MPNQKKKETTKTVSIPLVSIHCFGISENNYKIQQRQLIAAAVLGFRQNRFKPKQSITKTQIFINEIIQPLTKCWKHDFLIEDNFKTSKFYKCQNIKTYEVKKKNE